MDPELKKGFQELQAQVIQSRSKISNIDLCTNLTTRDAKFNDSILESFTDGGPLESKYFYQPIGRMLVRQEGQEALDFLLQRKEDCQEKLKHFKEVKEACLVRVKESENSLRELVNKKLNKPEQVEDKTDSSNDQSKLQETDKDSGTAKN